MAATPSTTAVHLQAPLLLALLVLSLHHTAAAQAASSPSAVCNIRDFGAVGDNQTEATQAIQTAINHCLAAGRAGAPSLVVVPAPGKYLTRPLVLGSYLKLHIEAGAMLVAWPDWPSWPNATDTNCSASPYETPNPHIVPQRQSFISAPAGTQQLAITGGGALDGQGWRWWPLAQQKPVSEYWHNCRPKMLQFHQTTDLLLRDFTVLDSPMFHIVASGLKRADIRNVTLHSGCGFGVAPNTDGFNLAGEDIYLADSRVHNGDDCVPINLPSRNITVERVSCECGNGLVPIVWGEGSATREIADITFRDCTVANTGEGCTIKSLPSYNGTVRNVLWENITFSNVAQGLLISAFEQNLRSGRLGHMAVHNVTFRNIRGTVGKAGKFECYTDSAGCDGVELDTVVLDAQQGYTCQGVSGTSTPDCKPTPCIQASGSLLDHSK